LTSLPPRAPGSMESGPFHIERCRIGSGPGSLGSNLRDQRSSNFRSCRWRSPRLSQPLQRWQATHNRMLSGHAPGAEGETQCDHCRQRLQDPRVRRSSTSRATSRPAVHTRDDLHEAFGQILLVTAASTEERRALTWSHWDRDGELRLHHDESLCPLGLP
jgi:hypothetical protein